MSRLNKHLIRKMLLDAGRIETPRLNRYFKYVFVGIEMKDRIQSAKQKAKIYW